MSMNSQETAEFKRIHVNSIQKNEYIQGRPEETSSRASRSLAGPNGVQEPWTA